MKLEIHYRLPLIDHDGSVAEQDALAEALVPDSREAVGREPDVLAVGRVELERREVGVGRRRVAAVE